MRHYKLAALLTVFAPVLALVAVVATVRGQAPEAHDDVQAARLKAWKDGHALAKPPSRPPPTCLPGYDLDMEADDGNCVRTIHVPITCDEVKAERHFIYIEWWLNEAAMDEAGMMVEPSEVLDDVSGVCFPEETKHESD